MLQLAHGLLRLALLATALTAFASSTAVAQIRQAYLIQNSGWMEPFYADPSSPFRPFIDGLVTQSRLNGVEVALASFNQDGQTAGRASPHLLYSGPFDVSAVRTAVSERLDLPTKASGGLTDTDYAGALQAASSQLLGPDGGIVWMVVNNKNSPDNSQDVRNNTAGFYAALSRDVGVTRIAAFLVRMPVQGRHYRERGLVVYAIARGEPGARALDLILSRASPLRTGLLRGNPPLRLKPLERQPVELRITGTLTGGRARAVMDAEILVVSGVAAGEPVRLRLAGELTNSLYPYRIEHAVLTPVWTRVGGRGAEAAARAAITPRVLTNLSSAPGASTQVTLDLSLPPLTPRDMLEERAHLDGLLEVRLSDVRLGFDPSFQERAAGVFGGDVLTAAAGSPGALPDLFYAHRSVTTAATRQPVRLLVEFSALPLWGLAGGGLLVLLLAGATWVWLNREIRFRSGFVGREVRLPSGKWRYEVEALDGRRVRIQRRLFGTPSEAYLSG